MLVLGGTRSGKSAVAERLAQEVATSRQGAVIYVATGYASDPDMAERIAAHQDRRPADWRTLEAGTDLPGALAGAGGDTVLLDSLGTWVARHDDLEVDPSALCEALTARVGDTVVVSEEVGLSLHAPSAAGRQFTDALGLINQAVAEVADQVWLVVAGRVLRLDRLDAHLTGGPLGGDDQVDESG